MKKTHSRWHLLFGAFDVFFSPTECRQWLVCLQLRLLESKRQRRMNRNEKMIKVKMLCRLWACGRSVTHTCSARARMIRTLSEKYNSGYPSGSTFVKYRFTRFLYPFHSTLFQFYGESEHAKHALCLVLGVCLFRLKRIIRKQQTATGEMQRKIITLNSSKRRILHVNMGFVFIIVRNSYTNCASSITLLVARSLFPKRPANIVDTWHSPFQRTNWIHRHMQNGRTAEPIPSNKFHT